ncbi:MAG: hypothetical protein ABSE53_07030 [Terracidiphilus sp.]|jgi:hypothetical protein
MGGEKTGEKPDPVEQTDRNGRQLHHNGTDSPRTTQGAGDGSVAAGCFVCGKRMAWPLKTNPANEYSMRNGHFTPNEEKQNAVRKR